jgi:single-strand DNA-binding protein
MYALKNKVQLIGYLGQAPEVKTTDSDRKYAKFRLATNEDYKNSKGEKISETQWHQLIAWGKVADLAEKFLRKGSEVAIEGKLMYNEFTDAGGVKRYFTEIQVNEILLLDKKAEKEIVR